MYTMSMTLTLLVLCVAVIGAEFTCYLCTYVLTSDPMANYNCVTDPKNVTQGPGSMPCTSPNMCLTRTVFGIDMKTIRSSSRSCHYGGEICEGESCCNENGPYHACEHKCQDDLCNDRNPEIWLNTGSDVNLNKHQINSDVCDDCNSAGCFTSKLFLAVITMFIYMFI